MNRAAAPGFAIGLIILAGGTCLAGQLPTHGIMVGEVTSSSAIVWSRADREAMMHVTLKTGTRRKEWQVVVRAEDDYTGQIQLRHLEPATRYQYQVWFTFDGEQAGESGERRAEGTFTTAPGLDRDAAVKLIWTGDIAGQNVCRDAREGFPIFNAMARERADFFIGLGDMIYADHVCNPVGLYGNEQVPGDFIPAADLANFWAHWRYSRADPGFQELLARTAYYGIWDDHEVINDFGPGSDTGADPPYTPGAHLLPLGLRAFLDYTPMAQRAASVRQLYRTVRWGKRLELFFLDNRQYRDANLDTDVRKRPRTMLGRTQVRWLKTKLKSSRATWNVIVTSVPLSIPTGLRSGAARDGWADFAATDRVSSDGPAQPSNTGFEAELADIFKTLQTTRSHAVFITTDVHFAEVLRYTPDAGNPGFKVYELAVGPGNAGSFPNRDLDPTFGPESLFFFGPETAESITSWEEAKRWFNYGVIEIDAAGSLRATVKDTFGTQRFELRLDP